MLSMLHSFLTRLHYCSVLFDSGTECTISTVIPFIHNFEHFLQPDNVSNILYDEVIPAIQKYYRNAPLDSIHHLTETIVGSIVHNFQQLSKIYKSNKKLFVNLSLATLLDPQFKNSGYEL